MNPHVFRVVKYDGLYTQTVCFTFSIQTAENEIERELSEYAIAYFTTVKRLLDRTPPVVILKMWDDRGFVREWQYTIIKIKVIE